VRGTTRQTHRALEAVTQRLRDRHLLADVVLRDLTD
jgi:hypothetical protein